MDPSEKVKSDGKLRWFASDLSAPELTNNTLFRQGAYAPMVSVAIPHAPVSQRQCFETEAKGSNLPVTLAQ
jgi:hypothetical protein